MTERNCVITSRHVTHNDILEIIDSLEERIKKLENQLRMVET